MTASQILLPGNSEEPKGHTYFWDIHPPGKNGEGDLARSLSRFPKCHHLDPISFLPPRVRLCNVGPFKDRNCQRHSPLWESNWWLTREAIVLLVTLKCHLTQFHSFASFCQDSLPCHLKQAIWFWWASTGTAVKQEQFRIQDEGLWHL